VLDAIVAEVAEATRTYIDKVGQLRRPATLLRRWLSRDGHS
jgi:hypothetical protein